MRKVRPFDKDAVKKFEECQKIVKRMAFEKAISMDHERKSFAESINVESIGELVEEYS